MHPENPRRTRRPALKWAGIAAVAAVALSGCSEQVERGWLPGSSDAEVTNQTGRITDLWVGSWVAALIVGLITWGLMLWCVAVYRKRKSDDVLPVQLRYHVPLEIMYVILPIVMVGVLFYFTNRDMSEITDTNVESDVDIQVIGKQWSWDFNYLDDDVYETGEHAQNVGSTEGVLDDQVCERPAGVDCEPHRRTSAFRSLHAAATGRSLTVFSPGREATTAGRLFTSWAAVAGIASMPGESVIRTGWTPSMANVSLASRPSLCGRRCRTSSSSIRGTPSTVPTARWRKPSVRPARTPP